MHNLCQSLKTTEHKKLLLTDFGEECSKLALNRSRKEGAVRRAKKKERFKVVPAMYTSQIHKRIQEPFKYLKVWEIITFSK